MFWCGPLYMCFSTIPQTECETKAVGPNYSALKSRVPKYPNLKQWWQQGHNWTSEMAYIAYSDHYKIELQIIQKEEEEAFNNNKYP